MKKFKIFIDCIDWKKKNHFFLSPGFPGGPPFLSASFGFSNFSVLSKNWSGSR